MLPPATDATLHGPKLVMNATPLYRATSPTSTRSSGCTVSNPREALKREALPRLAASGRLH